MPELPDVESFKRYFKRTSLNKKIVGVEVENKTLIKKSTFKRFKKKLINKEFVDAKRRGKFLIVEIKNSPEKLIFHFGMTGSFNYVKESTPKVGRDRFTRITFKFDNRRELRWRNMRKLGKVYLLKNPEKINLIKEMGPEPLSLSKKELLDLLEKHKRRNIKSFLLNQRIIAGIGNIYSDEILFQAKIDPHRKIKTLSKKERERVYQKMQAVLKEASNLSHPGAKFPKSWLLPYRKDKQCPNFKTHKLKREIIAGRPSYFCPKCQT